MKDGRRKWRVSPINTQRPTNMWGGQECVLITLAFCLSFSFSQLKLRQLLKSGVSNVPSHAIGSRLILSEDSWLYNTLTSSSLNSKSDILLQRAMGSEGTSVWLQSAFKQLMLQWELEMLMRPVRNHQIHVKHWSSIKTGCKWRSTNIRQTTIHQPNNQHR